jgi:hypothetical protein
MEINEMNPIDSWKGNQLIKDNPILFGHLEKHFRIIEKRYQGISEEITKTKLSAQSDKKQILSTLTEIEMLSYFTENGFDVIYEPRIKNGELITKSYSGDESRSDLAVKIGKRWINFEIKTIASSFIEKQTKLGDISQRLEDRIANMLKAKVYPFGIDIRYGDAFLEPINTLDKRVKQLVKRIQILCDNHKDEDDLDNPLEFSFPDDENCVAKIWLFKSSEEMEGTSVSFGPSRLVPLSRDITKEPIRKARKKQSCDNYPNIVVIDVSAEPNPVIWKLDLEYVLYGGTFLSGLEIRKEDDGRSCLIPNRNGLFHLENPHFSSRISAVMAYKRNRIAENLSFERIIFENPNVDRNKRLYDDEIRILKG